MQVADVLSDLNSLQVCDPNAALALVSARPNSDTVKESNSGAGNDSEDVDLKRAKDLIELHSTVKVAHEDGTDQKLNESREAVEKVLRTLK